MREGARQGRVDLATAYRALLEMMAALHACATLGELETVLTRRVSDVVPADLVSLNKIDLTGDMGGSMVIFAPELVPPSLIAGEFDRYLDQHPLVQDYVRTGDGSPRRMSDYIDVEDFRRLELYERVFKPLRSLHQIAFSVQQVPGMVLGVGINRTTDDFSDDELQVARAMYEQVPAAFHHVQLREIHDREQRMPSVSGLTAREREVLVYLRAGLSSREIAESLQVGRRTVEKHLERLYAKLGVRSRTAAVNAVWHRSAQA